MVAIERIAVNIHEIPLRAPFATARDSAPRTAARVVRMEAMLSDGRTVIGEAAPAAYVTGETCDTVLEDVAAVSERFAGLDGARLVPMLRLVDAALPADRFTARAGLEVIAYRIYGAATGQDLWRYFGGARESVETDISVSRAENAVAAVTRAEKAGFRTVKVKVGSSPDDEVQRILEMHSAAPSLRFRVDANQAYTAQDALELARKLCLANLPVEIMEQPVPWDDVEALARVAEASPIPVVADEAVKTPEDALRVVTQTKVHAINVKIMKSGVTGALGILGVLKAAGRKAMIGCMLESTVGISFSAWLACGTGAFSYVDLDSHLLLDQPTENPWFIQNGPRLTVAGSPPGNRGL